MIGTLNVVVLALAAYIVFDEPDVVVQRAAAMQTPPQEQEDAEPAEPEHSEAPEAARAEAEKNAEVEVEVPGAPKTEEAEPAREAASRRGHGNRRHAGRAQRGHTDPEPVAAKPKPGLGADKKGPADLPIDCIVNPQSCGRGAKGPRTAAQGPRQRVEEDLPTTLGQSALRAGFGKVRAEAKACGPKHGVSGQQIAVKVSISGTTGAVTSARALGSHAKTPIGNCVAAALRRASFDRFAKPLIGIKYTVRL